MTADRAEWSGIGAALLFHIALIAALSTSLASIKDVARYAPITRGVNLEQSPTVVVVKGKTADALVGYVDSKSIDQAVSDVMRSSK